MFGRLLARDNDTTAISITDWARMFRPGIGVTYNSQRLASYTLSSASQGGQFYDTNAVVFACAANRMLLFAEARFQFQQLRQGRPGDLFGTPALGALEEPWIGATTGDLLAQAELDVACYGNSYWVNDGPYLQRLDPCNVTVVTVGAFDGQVTGYQVGEKLGGYLYRQSAQDPGTFYEPDQIGHYKPYPSRTNRFVGMSWLNPCLPDIDADIQMTEHKRSVLRDGAAIPYVVSLNEGLSPEAFDEFVAAFTESHQGAANSGKPLFLGGGADIKTVGQSFEQLAVKATQGAGETRIAACAGVPPVIVGLSEGLSSATYSNYSQARRRLVDGTMRPLWRLFASAMQSVIVVPGGARLWYDDRDIPFLREDVTDQANIKSIDAQTIKALTDAGFEPDVVIDAVMAGDLSRLAGSHSGLFSVQLQPPGTEQPQQVPSETGPRALMK